MFELEKITASNKELMDQAMDTAWDYYNDIAYRFDKLYGKGWSKEHPEVVAKMATVAAKDFNTTLTVKNLQQLALATDELSRQAFNISESISKIG